MLDISAPLLLTKPSILFAFVQRSTTCFVHVRLLLTQIPKSFSVDVVVSSRPIVDVLRVDDGICLPSHVHALAFQLVKHKAA